MIRKKHRPKTQSAESGVRRFLLLFLGLVAAYYLITLIPWVDRNILYPVLEFSARSSSLLINLAGERTTTNGIRIQGPTFAVAVRRGCDPLEPIVLLGSAIIAFPASWKRRVLGIAVGGSLLFLINILRITSLYWLGKGKSHLFETVHLELWPALFILLSLILWVLWLLWVRHNDTAAEHA
jgi:exosortase H (IPTLxxWG-CTERM-specific)